MSSNQYKDLQCAVSDDDHILQKPIRLTNCMHCICKNCLPNRLKSIKCKICGIITDKDLIIDEECISSKNSIKDCLTKLYSILQEKYDSKLQSLKDYKDSQESSFDTYLKYLEDEIEIRVESLKDELDDIFDDFKNQLKEVKEDFFKNLSDRMERNYKLEEYENVLTELNQQVKSENAEKDEENFYKYEKCFINLDKGFTKLTQMKYQLTFSSCEDQLKPEIVGKISYKKYDSGLFMSDEAIREKLKNNEFKKIELANGPYDMCVLLNNKIATANFTTSNLTVFNENFELLETITKISDYDFQPAGIAAHENSDRIYIADYKNHRIIMTDSEFSKTKIFGSLGSDNYHLHCPCCVVFKKDSLYICDNDNRRIQILNAELEYLKSINVEYLPLKIAVTDKTICISTTYDLFFYDINKPDKQIKKITNKGGRISTIDSIIYQLSSHNKKVYCYSEDGDMIEEIDIEKFGNAFYGSEDGYFLCYQKNLFILGFNKKIMIQI